VNFLLDTNIVSEWARPQPSERVMRWLGEVEEERIFLSVVSLAEIQHGVDALPAKTATSGRSIVGMSLPCHPASQATISSRRPSEPAGLVNRRWRCATASIAC